MRHGRGGESGAHARVSGMEGGEGGPGCVHHPGQGEVLHGGDEEEEDVSGRAAMGAAVFEDSRDFMVETSPPVPIVTAGYTWNR